MRNPEVPESLDGWHILHRLFHFDRRRFGGLSPDEREAVGDAARVFLAAHAERDDRDCGVAQLLGHKADLMVTHYARSFDDLATVQMQFDQLALRSYLSPGPSYVSILELGLYDATAKIHAGLAERGLRPLSDEWTAAFDAALAEQARSPRNAARLFAAIPRRRYVCFYPMNKRRGEHVNWYDLPFAERAQLMVDHGKIGRTYHGLVTQVISGSIGFDDWEWGVDLYADDPIVFKKLIYEMRFDAASSRFGEFGEFFTGVQFSIAELPRFLLGDHTPQLLVAAAVAGRAGR